MTTRSDMAGGANIEMSLRELNWLARASDRLTFHALGVRAHE